MAVQRLSAPGISHVSTVVLFSGDISEISPLRHTAIRTMLREWGQQLATEWNQWLTRHDDNLVPTDGIEVGGLRTARHEPAVVLPELLVDDLPLDIVSQCDESPVPHILSPTLTPYLQWSACLEEHIGNNNPPSQRQYLDPREIIDLAFFQPRTASEDEALTPEEEEEEGVEEGDEEEEETSEEPGSYSEYSEEEPGEEEEEEEEEEESEWETLGEEPDRAETQEEDPEAARRREEIAARKQPLEFASGVDLPIPNDPAKHPEPPKNDDGDLAAETSSAPARRRRSRSPSPPPPPVYQFDLHWKNVSVASAYGRLRGDVEDDVSIAKMLYSFGTEFDPEMITRPKPIVGAVQLSDVDVLGADGKCFRLRIVVRAWSFWEFFARIKNRDRVGTTIATARFTSLNSLNSNTVELMDGTDIGRQYKRHGNLARLPPIVVAADAGGLQVRFHPWVGDSRDLLPTISR
ncbi:hypothetical protein CBR_g50383 [Chara braunii]|uniref:Uncharacterized protein n=1 Tax=Chara braunii TaxID=69332 RepID=A0A388M6W7_CHABU|nr:hypothetical protein CBR_g50383 [Chara braunii]|eukprot:GBG90202.1 hypothetical protein CBR_g50383 [Chara braunii]